MKKIIFLILFFILIPSILFSATLNLTATWTANTEPDMAWYKLYRTDSGRVLIATIPFPATSYSFSVTVPDGGSGTLTFVLTAGDTINNESGDSNVAPFSYDFKPPQPPANFIVK